MLLTDHWQCSIFFLSAYLCHVGQSSECGNYSKNDVIIVAFLNVRDETDCTRLSLRGLQQMAMLKKSLTRVNDEEAPTEGLHLVLHIVDTCNPTERQVETALRNLVKSQQCSHPPLLLGFIGPEKNWKSIQRITSEFHKLQILPFLPETKEILLPESLLLHVGNDRQPLRSKIFLTTLNQLRWKSAFIVIAGHMDKKKILDNVFNEVDRICVTGLIEIPKDSSTLNSFYSALRKEYLDTNSDGIILFAHDPNDVRPLLQEMDQSSSDESNPPILLYVCNVGLKSWELPHNHTILVLQETSDYGAKFSLNSYHNKSLWDQYYAQNEVDYRRDAFETLLDASLAPYKYSFELYWNAVKYAKKIKCDLGSAKNVGICFDMLRASPLEWKSFVHKMSYFEADSLRKISLEMNLPVTVRLYFVNSVINFPQEIGRITENGIMDLKMNLQSVIPSKAVDSSLRKCIPPANQRNRFFSPIPMDHESNWLAVFSKKMKSWINVNGLISLETTEVIHNTLVWIIGFIAFVLGLIIITKCVYGVFKVRSDEERNASLRRKSSRRSTRIHRA